MPLIDRKEQLPGVADALRSAETLYLDTEFESSRAEKTLCLVQVSRGDEVFLIDPLKLGSLSALREVFANPETEWVLHAGLQDVELLTEALDIPAPARLFDTQVAWSLLSPENAVALAYLKFVVLGIRSGKAHQADDWKRRPLPDSQLKYAAEDIEQLPALRRELGARAERLQRLDIIRGASREAVSFEAPAVEPLSLSSFRHAWQLNVESQAALRYLIEWYNALPDHEQAAAPDPKTLLAIAQRLPRSGRDLGRIKGVPRRWVERAGDRFTADLTRATRGARSADFVPVDPPPYATFEEIRLDGWLALARAELSVELGVAPEILMPGRQLKRLKAALGTGSSVADALNDLSAWRRALIGTPFAEFCATHPPPPAGTNPAGPPRPTAGRDHDEA